MDAEGTDNTTLVTTWCRMWGEEPDLARDVVAPAAQHWSGEPDAPDEVDGREQQVRRAAGRGDGEAVAVLPTLVVDGGDAVAFLWEATGPDTAVTTGLDLLALDDGLVTRSWTFVAAQTVDLGVDQAPADGEGLDRAGLVALAQSWLAVWQATSAPDAEVVSPDFVAWSGTGDADPDLRGAEALAAHVERGREGRGAVSVQAHGEPVVDVERQRVALLWTATERGSAGTTEVGGVDVLAVREGRVARSWTLRGARAFTF